MRYAKLIDGNLVYAPRKLTVGENTVYNPTEEMILDAGYKPVVYTDAPETDPGYEAVHGWYDDGDSIREVWTVVEKTEFNGDEAMDYLFTEGDEV